MPESTGGSAGETLPSEATDPAELVQAGGSRRLRWFEGKVDRLGPNDAKTGPGHIFLSRADARLHELHHAHASDALMNGAACTLLNPWPSTACV